MSAMTSIYFNTNQELGTRYFNLATSKAVDEWLMGTVKDLESLIGGGRIGYPMEFFPF